MIIFSVPSFPVGLIEFTRTLITHICNSIPKCLKLGSSQDLEDLDILEPHTEFVEKKVEVPLFASSRLDMFLA